MTWSRALITGASSGIGQVMARRLALAGTGLVVVARRRDELEKLAGEVTASSGAEVEVIPADLVTDEGVTRVEERLRDAARPVDLLVNNAGFGTAGRFARIDPGRVQDEIRLNVLAVARLTAAALPGMIERGGGSILNVASVAGLQPLPGFANYAATKAYVIHLSEALHEEVRGTGVTVTALAPGFTRTNFQARAGHGGRGLPGFVWMQAEPVAAAGLAAAARGDALCVPGFGYQALAALTRPIPRSVVRRVTGLGLRRGLSG